MAEGGQNLRTISVVIPSEAFTHPRMAQEGRTGRVHAGGNRPKSPTFGDVDDARPTPQRPRSRIQEGGYGLSERLGPTSSLSARLDRQAHNLKCHRMLSC